LGLVLNMNLNLTPTNEEFASYTPLEKMLVTVHADLFRDDMNAEEIIEYLQDKFFIVGKYFIDSPEEFNNEWEHQKTREEPDNIIKVDFS
jgi:hypothetical protein